MKYVKVLYALIVISVIATSVHASGFSLPFMSNSELRLFKGDSKLVPVTLQNGENKTVLLTVTQTEGKNVSYLMNETEQLMPPYTYNRKVYLNISIPKNAKIGDVWRVSFDIRSVTPNATGMITFSTQVAGAFNVKLVEKPKETKLKAWHVAVCVVIIILIGGVWFFERRRKKKDEAKQKDPLEDMFK